MTFSFDIDKKSAGGFGEEGRLREALAAYFLSAPAPERQTPGEQARYKRALRRMAELEAVSILQSAAIRRPLRYGDLNALLSSIVEACAIRFRDEGVALEFNIPEKSICTAAEPRLVSVALIRLLRAFAAANREGMVGVHVISHEQSMSVTVKGKYPVLNPQALALVRVASRLHKGGVAVSGGTVAFSLKTGLQGAVGLFAAPSVNELLSSPLSPVNIGLA